MKKIHESVHVLCFHVNKIYYESTKTCMSPGKFPFSAYFPPPHYIVMVKGLLNQATKAIYSA